MGQKLEVLLFDKSRNAVELILLNKWIKPFIFEWQTESHLAFFQFSVKVHVIANAKQAHKRGPKPCELHTFLCFHYVPQTSPRWTHTVEFLHLNGLPHFRVWSHISSVSSPGTIPPSITKVNKVQQEPGYCFSYDTQIVNKACCLPQNTPMHRQHEQWILAVTITVLRTTKIGHKWQQLKTINIKIIKQGKSCISEADK